MLGLCFKSLLLGCLSSQPCQSCTHNFVGSEQPQLACSTPHAALICPVQVTKLKCCAACFLKGSLFR